MSLKTSTGNMYPWVTHMHTHLGGECPHKCVYCYVNNRRFGRPERYKGPIRLIESELRVGYGKKKTIFIEHKNDLFCEDVPDDMISRILEHCCEYPKNRFVFQTKNPIRYFKFLDKLPPDYVLGVTIETNRNIPEISEAPSPRVRMMAMEALRVTKFVTIEPVLDFDVEILAAWIKRINPTFLNLGADSKGHDLPEPSVEKIMKLVARLADYGIELREKHNLSRLKEKG